MQTELEALKAEIERIEAGQWVSTTIHDIAAAARALIHKIEGKTDGHSVEQETQEPESVAVRATGPAQVPGE